MKQQHYVGSLSCYIADLLDRVSRLWQYEEPIRFEAACMSLSARPEPLVTEHEHKVHEWRLK